MRPGGGGSTASRSTLIVRARGSEREVPLYLYTIRRRRHSGASGRARLSVVPLCMVYQRVPGTRAAARVSYEPSRERDYHPDCNGQSARIREGLTESFISRHRTYPVPQAYRAGSGTRRYCAFGRRGASGGRADRRRRGARRNGSRLSVCRDTKQPRAVGLITLSLTTYATGLRYGFKHAILQHDIQPAAAAAALTATAFPPQILTSRRDLVGATGSMAIAELEKATSEAKARRFYARRARPRERPPLQGTTSLRQMPSCGRVPSQRAPLYATGSARCEPTKVSRGVQGSAGTTGYGSVIQQTAVPARTAGRYLQQRQRRCSRRTHTASTRGIGAEAAAPAVGSEAGEHGVGGADVDDVEGHEELDDGDDLDEQIDGSWGLGEPGAEGDGGGATSGGACELSQAARHGCCNGRRR